MADHDYLPLTVPGNSLLCPVCYFDILWVFTHPAHQYDNSNKRIRLDLHISKLETCVYKAYNSLTVLTFNLLLVLSNAQMKIILVKLTY